MTTRRNVLGVALSALALAGAGVRDRVAATQPARRPFVPQPARPPADYVHCC